MARKKRKWLRRIGIAFAILVAYMLYAHWPVEYKITVSPETTYLTGPLRPDGTVNYLAALNQQLSDGVTPENNAGVLLVQAIGPAIFDVDASSRWLETLGIDDLPAEGDYFISFRRFLENREDSPSATDPDQAADEYEDPRDRVSRAIEAPWRTEDFPDISAWLEAIDGPLALAVEASSRPRYYIPLLSADDHDSMLDVVIPTLTRIAGLSKALTARAMRKLSDGDVAGSRRDLMACHRLARLLGQGMSIVSRLVMIAIDADACQGVIAAATSGKLPSADARAILADLQKLPALPHTAEAMDRCERLFSLDCITQLSRGRSYEAEAEATGPLAALAGQMDWDLMLREFNQYFNRMAAIQRMPHAERTEANRLLEKECDAFFEDGLTSGIKTILFRLGGRPFRKNMTRQVSRILLSLLMPTLNRASELYDIARMKFELTKLALALAAMKEETGAYPADLNALTPEYVPEIPQDLFSLKPLIYRRTEKGYVLYSVGCNMIDDGGREGKEAGEDEDPRPDDVVVEAASGRVRFWEEETFLRRHTQVVGLSSFGRTRVLVAPALQGRVMAATGGGAKGQSFGIVNRKLVEAGEAKRKFNGYGGGDRIWLGPEAGPFGLFCPAGETINRTHWQAPAAVNEGAFEMVHRTEDYVELRKSMEVTNAAGTTFTLMCDREIRVLDRYDVRTKFGLPPLKSVRTVAYASENRITNTGKVAWRKETGLLSIWIVGVFRTSPGAVAILPFRTGPEAELGKRVTDDYFGKVTPERLAVGDGVAFYRIDGGQVGKVGISSRRSKGVFGSYDPGRGALTLVKFSMPPAPAGYVNYEWLEKPATPYEGDAIMVYCSGPKVAGTGQRGGAYELETASPAAALAPGESMSHTHTTVHLTGSRADLDKIARAALGVSLDQVDAAWGKQPTANSD